MIGVVKKKVIPEMIRKIFVKVYNEISIFYHENNNINLVQNI